MNPTYFIGIMMLFLLIAKLQIFVFPPFIPLIPTFSPEIQSRQLCCILLSCLLQFYFPYEIVSPMQCWTNYYIVAPNLDLSVAFQTQ